VHGTRQVLAGYALGAAALVVCYLVVPAQRPLWWVLGGLLAVAAVGYGVLRYRPRPVLPWLLIGAALLAEVAGDLAYHVAGGSVGGRSPFPTAADGFHLALYPIAVCALLAFVWHDPPEHSRGLLLDALITVIGLGAVTWSAFVIPYTHLAHESAPAKSILIAYLVGDALLLAMTLHLPAAGRMRSRPVWLLVAGTFGLLFSDAYYALSQLHPTWSPGLLGALGWGVFFVAWGMAALLPEMERVASPPSGRPWTLVAPRSWVALMWFAALLSPVLLLLDTSRATHRETQTLAVFGIVAFALVFARLAWALRSWRESVLRRETESYLRTLIADALDAIIIASRQGEVRFASRSAATLFGDRLERGSVVELFAQRERPRVSACFEQLTDPDSRPDWPTTVHVDAHDGRALVADARWSDLRADPSVGGIALTLRDVTEERRLHDELRQQALTDPLTGLANRQGLMDLVRSMYVAAEVPGAGSGTGGLLLIDLDDFKEVNDTLGHPVGDEVLIAVAGRISGRVRETDVVARLGGDEFAVLLARGPDPAELGTIAQRLVDAFDEPLETGAGPLRVVASLGLAVFGSSHTESVSGDAEALLRNADLALYAAKAEGKHRWHRYHIGLLDKAVHRAELRAALDEALLSGDLTVWYQPVVYLDSRYASGFEALVRWPHPRLGLLSPDEFIPLAEQTGQIVEIGRQMMRIAAGQAAVWHDAHPEVGCYIGVNVSVHQLRRDDFVETVDEVLASTGVDPEYMVLEVTETALLDNEDVGLRERLHALRDLGLRITLDDFGTGYASMISLHDMPIDIIKIDKSFTSRLTTSERMRRLVRGLLAIGETMGIRTVAEGVETWEQHDCLLELGCRAGQGYLYAKPMPADQASALWTARSPLPHAEPGSGAGRERGGGDSPAR
jgi:diguanylate cyclase (GGDEF)-like protein/PAS domain S-box-containing protein